MVDLVETILVYKLPRLSREEIQTMLELTDTDLKQTRFYQDVFTEGEIKRAVGRQEGGKKAVKRAVKKKASL